jgi:hypothetical protein
MAMRLLHPAVILVVGFICIAPIAILTDKAAGTRGKGLE